MDFFKGFVMAFFLTFMSLPLRQGEGGKESRRKGLKKEQNVVEWEFKEKEKVMQDGALLRAVAKVDVAGGTRPDDFGVQQITTLMPTLADCKACGIPHPARLRRTPGTSFW